MTTQPVAENTISRRILEQSPDALVLVDLDACIVFANAQAERLFGYARGALVGKPLEVLVPEIARAAHGRGFRLLATQPPDGPNAVGRQGHLRGRKQDGSTFPVEVIVSEVRTAAGVLFAASVRDETSREAALVAVREMEERFRLAIDEAPIGMAIVGLDGSFLRVNHALCSIVGYTSDELTGLTFQAITHPEDLDIDVELAGKLARGEIPRYTLPKRYVRKDGAVVDVMLYGSVARDREGKPLYYIAQVLDVTAQKHAEAALRRSEQNFRSLIEQAPEGVFVADLEGRYTDVNSAACRMLGYSREELVGKTIVDLIPPEDVPRLAASKELMQVAGRVHFAEWTLRRKDGVRVPVEVSAMIHPDGRWVAFVRDFSDRKRNEEALRRSEESLARAQRAAHLGTWEWDVRTNHVVRSKELYEVFGLPPGGAAPPRRSTVEYIHPDDRERVARVLDDAAREGRAYTLEHRIVRADGAERVVLQHGEPILEDGRTVRVVGTLLDVTDRRRAELEREATVKWLRAVFESSPVGLLLVHGTKGARVEANGRAVALMGFRMEGILEDPETLLDASGSPVPEDQLPNRRAGRGERVEPTEYIVRQPGGALVPVLASAAPIRDASGNVEGAVVAFQDITAAKELERLRAEWGSVVAHDLRQPLNVMVLQAQIVLRKTADPEAREAIQRIQAAGKRLARMIGDLMDLSRLDARRLDLDTRPSDLVSLVRESVGRFTLEAPGRPFDVRVRGDVRPANVDPDRIAQILDNLLSNAVKYGAPGTPIVVEVEAQGRELSVAVTNSGKGIASEQLPVLFQRFQRRGGEDSRIKGVGLGLYIARELVEAHGGQLTFETTPGATTTFRFTLPASA